MKGTNRAEEKVESLDRQLITLVNLVNEAVSGKEHLMVELKKSELVIQGDECVVKGAFLLTDTDTSKNIGKLGIPMDEISEGVWDFYDFCLPIWTMDFELTLTPTSIDLARFAMGYELWKREAILSEYPELRDVAEKLMANTVVL